jgi:putative DNA methylase
VGSSPTLSLQRGIEAQIIVEQLRSEMADFIDVRTLLVHILTFIERKTEVRSSAEVLRT